MAGDLDRTTAIVQARQPDPDGRTAIRAADPAAQALIEAKYEREREAEDASVPPNTMRAYLFERDCYRKWCSRHGVRPVPADPRVLVVYIRELAHLGRDPRDMRDAEKHPAGGPLRYGSVMRALGAICRFHTAADFPSPWTSGCLERARDALARELGVAVEKKRAATRDVLHAIVDQIDRKTLTGARDAALLLLGERVAGRRSELAAARVEHFRRHKDQQGREGVVWLIPRSKTDQAGVGQEVPILPKQSARYCAIAATRHWLEVAGISSGFLFRQVSALGVLERPISPEKVAKCIKHYAKKAGFDPADFGAHSLRSGRITMLAERRETAQAIKRISRHKSTSVLEGYIQYANVLDDVPGGTDD